MKTLRKTKSRRSPISVSSIIVMGATGVLCLIAIVLGFRKYFYSMSINQLNIFASVIFITIISAGCQNIVCESFEKNNTTASSVAITTIACLVSVVLSYRNAGAFVSAYEPLLIYFLYWFVAFVLCLALTCTMVYLSVLLSIALYGSAKSDE